MQERIEQLKAELLALSAQTVQELEELRIKYISKKGLIPQLFDAFKTVPSEQKRLVGQQLNELKELATSRINELRAALAGQGTSHSDIDWSRSAYPTPLGTRHPLTLVQQEITEIFSRLGFSIAQLRRGSPRARHAGYLLREQCPWYAAAHAHLLRTDTRHALLRAPYPHHLPRACVPQ